LSTLDGDRRRTGESYPPIEDYGLIGDCHTAALVGSHGSIDWLCLPRFDSPSVFARILDLERGGAWSIAPTARFHVRRRYLEDTNVLETIFAGDRGRVRLLDFMPASAETAEGKAHPSHTVVRIIEGVEGELEVESRCSPRPDYGRVVPAFDVRGRRARFGGFTLTAPGDWRIDEDGGAVSCRVTVRQGERVAFTLHYEDESHPDGDVEDPHAELEETIRFWRGWAGRCTYHGSYRDAVVRSALALKLLINAPSGAIVAAPTTSLPEEIGGERNWDYRFTWIRDASFTLYALLLAGYTEEDDAFFDWIARTVKLEETGIRILYPISREGDATERVLDHLEGYRGSRPVRVGNAAARQVQLDVYGEVLDALYFACKAGRYDPRPVWDHFRPLIDWVSRNWRRPGNGIWEVRGGLRHFVYGKAMTWVALDRGIKLSGEYDLPGDVERWREEGEKIRAEVFEKGWSERLKAFKQSYEDERLDAANLLLPVVGFIEGDDPRMLSTVDATLDRLVADGLCYRYFDAPEGVGGSEASFALCTFWLVNALILAGRSEEARDLFERMLGRATPLGLFAEEIDPATGAHLGNFPQAFSHIGVINAAASLAQTGKEGAVRPENARAVDTAGTGGGGTSRSNNPGKKIGEPLPETTERGGIRP
jgi:GH15 family glucan-1,4-alpha-glucosidase